MVPAADSLEGKIQEVKDFVGKGVFGSRVMPAWNERLSPTEIKLLAVYAHQLGGGE
jgi:cytochrome c oxidase cbb3-type subunit 3